MASTVSFHDSRLIQSPKVEISPILELLSEDGLRSPSVCSALHSPVNLSVPFPYGLSPFVPVSQQQVRRGSSTASSIIDLSCEAEQLERAIRADDVRAVRKILQLHHGKFPCQARSISIIDRSSCESQPSRSRCNSRVSQTLTDEFDDRRQSVTPESEIPPIFRTSLHVAIQAGSYEVVKLLLRYDIDPNEPGTAPGGTSSSCRPRSCSSCSGLSASAVAQASPLDHNATTSTTNQATIGNRDFQTASSISTAYNHGNIASPDISGTTGISFSGNSRPSVTRKSRFPSKQRSCSLSIAETAKKKLIKHCIIVENPFEFSKNYQLDDLFSVQPLFFAVAEGKAVLVDLLLRYDARPNLQDRHGCTALHLASSSDFRNLDCARSLIRHGAQIHITSKYGVSPYDLFPDLEFEQALLISGILSGNFSAVDICGGAGAPSEVTYQPGTSISLSSNVSRRFFKRLNSDSKGRSKDYTKKSGRDSIVSDYDMRERDSSAGSYKSVRVQKDMLSGSGITEETESDTSLQDGVSAHDKSSSLKHRKSSSRKSKRRGSCVTEMSDKPSQEDTERSLHTLIKLASNPECISSLLDGLTGYLHSVLANTPQGENPVVDKAIGTLYNQIIQTCYEQLQLSSNAQEKHVIFLELSKLLQAAFELLKGRQSLHFTSLSAINRIIDICIVHRNYEIGSLTQQSVECVYSTSSVGINGDESVGVNTGSGGGSCAVTFGSGVHGGSLRNRDVPKDGLHSSSGAHAVDCNSTTSGRTHNGHKKSVSHDSAPERGAETEDESPKSVRLPLNRTPLEILTSVDPSEILNVLHNSITMHKRIAGARQKCTPSTRWRHCTYHCLEILSARILTVMCHGPIVQNKLTSDGHVKTLVEELDPNHDPQLLCLLLQCLACIALDPSFHQALADADVADMLMQLLLPSDEWYYTNHSTKYARFVKYHAARILVYMGLLHKLGGRVDLFDQRPFLSDTPNSLLQVHSPEDSFIELMALGQITIRNNNSHLTAASLEGLIAEVIKESMAEDDITCNDSIHSNSPVSPRGFPDISAVNVTDDTNHISHQKHVPLISPVMSPSCSMEFLMDLEKRPFRNFLLSALPILIHPVIILRLLAHKLFGNMIRRKTRLSPSSSRLQPPRVLTSDHCPPKLQQEAEEEALKEPLSKRRRGANLHVQISSPAKIESIHGIPSAYPGRRTNSISEKELNKCHSSLKNRNGSTKLALKAIGESLVTPLEFSITPSTTSQSIAIVAEDSSISSNTTVMESALKSTSSKKLFHWPSKKRLSKSQVNVSSMHRGSVVSQASQVSQMESNNSSSTPDIDVVAFQRELINLPTFVMDTPNVDISPVFSRSSSVPDHLASCGTIPAENSVENGMPALVLNPLVSFTQNISATFNGTQDNTNSSVPNIDRLTEMVVPKSGSLVTITTTDVDTCTGSPYSTQGDDALSDHLCVESSKDESSSTNITVHFEAPSSPVASSPSQSSVNVFDFPSIPEAGQPTISHLHPARDKLALVSLPSSANTSNENSPNPAFNTNTLFPVQFITQASSSSAGSVGSVSTCMFSEQHRHSQHSVLATCVYRSMPTAYSPIGEIPSQHLGVMKVVETWIDVSRSDLESNTLVVTEMRDFLNKLSVLGHEYKAWCHKIGSILNLEELNETDTSCEDPNSGETINAQYKKLRLKRNINLLMVKLATLPPQCPCGMAIFRFQKLIVSGELPCPKEDAATLAGIHLHVDEAWPDEEELRNHMSPDHLHGNNTHDKQLENLQRKKELIRANRAKKISTSRLKKKNRISRTLGCMSDHDIEQLEEEADLSLFLPPDFITSRKIKHLIQEKQKKLWHTPYYDSEFKLKQLYVKICKSLPAYGCKLYHVKEILRGNTQKKVTRLLGITPSKIILLDVKSKLVTRTQGISDLLEWSAGGGKAHDGLVLEFYGTKPWLLATPSPEKLKPVTTALWEAMDMDSRFLHNGTLKQNSFDFDFSRRHIILHQDSESASLYAEELDNLQRILHFPEEVAFLLTETEHDLFQRVPPASYIRQVTVDLTLRPTVSTGSMPGPVEDALIHPRVEHLIHRFKAVSSWVTQMIITQPTHEDRKAVLSCILRLIHYCWSIGNFSSAVEVLAGLRSDKLKPFWLSLSNEDLSGFHHLSNILMTSDPSPEYREAVSRALDIPSCKVIPFFGGFLRDLRSIFTDVPSIIVLPSDENQSLEFISDYNGEDRFMTRIGVGGLINLEKLRQAHIILNDIHLFHHHGDLHKRSPGQADSSDSSPDLGIESSTDPDLAGSEYESDSDSDYDLDLDAYQPIQPINSEHEVMTITPKLSHISLHMLQTMHHGCTAVHWELDSGRSCMCYIRLESTNGLLTWQKPPWSALRGNVATSGPDFCLKGYFMNQVSPGLNLHYSNKENVDDTLEEGFIDMCVVKSVSLASESLDISVISKRHGIHDATQENCICIQYGTNMAENKILYFLAPSSMARCWYKGLCSLVLACSKLKCQVDLRTQWLKDQYLSLFYENDRCQGPTPGDAVKVFGGRRWAAGPQTPLGQQSETQAMIKRASSFAVTSSIFKKKMSSSLSTVKDVSPKSSSSAIHSYCSSSNETCCSLAGGRHRNSPCSLRQDAIMTKTSVSDPTLSHYQHSAPNPGFRPRSLTFSFTNRYRSRRRRMSLGSRSSDNKTMNTITHSTQLSFLDFADLFKSFSLRCRKDLRDLFEQFATNNRLSETMPVRKLLPYSPRNKDMGLLTRNNALDFCPDCPQRRKICDAIAAASIVTNCTGVDTTHNQCLSVRDFQEFLLEYQQELLDDNEIIRLMQRHEPDAIHRERCCLSFEGFARYLMDKNNYAFLPEKTKHTDEDMNHPLSHYYASCSHNTYLTGHQLKGESSVELYSQVLLSGCRCVELDCWDGDDGMPIIYHGHTLTTKIPFKAVVEAVNRSAFVTSPYPVILSLENHCSIPQQQKMAQLFTSIFGGKLVTQYMFDSDYADDPLLPSPNQLKYKILIKNKKQRIIENPQIIKKIGLPAASRTNSMVSTESTGISLNDVEDDDEDEDEDEDDMTVVKEELTRRSLDSQDSPAPEYPKGGSTPHGQTDSFDESRSRSESLSDKPRPQSQPNLDWQFDDEIQETKLLTKAKQKKTNQIAKELSDLVVYTQAVKFRDLSVSPIVSTRQKKSATKKNILGTSPSASNVISAAVEKAELSLGPGLPMRIRRTDVTPVAHQLSSLNENKAKQLCRRHPTALINHTERQMMRTYPAGMRIDSSNFNPVIFWVFGIHMVAMNYQTDDAALVINATMFEQNGSSGFVLKPRVMRDKNHVMYNRFNPWDKEFDGFYATSMTLMVISGQYVSSNLAASVQVEVEILGIPVDCVKQKTKVVTRNALNPIWNDVFIFQVLFLDIAFIRFTVIDTGANHIVTQRVIPLKHLRPGYRHVRLRSITNQTQELASLFIFSKHEEEILEQTNGGSDSSFDGATKRRTLFAKGSSDRMDIKELGSPSQRHKRRMFFVSVFGVSSPDEYVIIKVTQDTNVYDAIGQALAKGVKSDERVEDHVLVEDVHSGWEKKDQEKAGQQRILDMTEKVLQAQNKWKGSGKFMLRKKSDDPSSRAWMTTIMTQEQVRNEGSENQDWDMDENMFLVCVYNVSTDQPYTIFKAPTTSMAQDIITQAMVKARRAEHPRNFVLIEQIEWTPSDSNQSSSGRQREPRTEKRVLGDDENVYQVQREWKSAGKFVLKDRDCPDSDTESHERRKRFTSTKGAMRLAKRFGSRKLTKSLSQSEDSSLPQSDDSLMCSSSSLAQQLDKQVPQQHSPGPDTKSPTTSRLKKISSKLHIKISK